MMHLRTLSLVASLAVSAVAQGPVTPSSDVSVGVFPFLVGNMDGRVQEIVNTCAQRGVDTIYVSVFRATGPSTGDLWITDNAGNWSAAWGPVRPGGAGINLSSLITAAHAADLRVVAVLKCFADSVQPTNASHRAYLLNVVGYLVDSFHPDGTPVYDLDGLALDYIRFVGSSSGNDSTLVTNLCRDIKQRIGRLSLAAYLLANRYTFDGPTYDLNFRSYNSAMSMFSSDYGQNWAAMAQWIDVLMPMCYTADGSIYNTYAEHQAYVRTAAQYARIACTAYPGRRVTPVVKTYSSSGETTTDQTVEASITGALQGGADGYQSFRYGTTLTSWWAKLQQYAVPGPNFPSPAIGTVLAGGLSATVDSSASQDLEDPSANLLVRFDWNDDSYPDTLWLPSGPATRLLPSPAGVTVGIEVRDTDGHVAVTRRRVAGTTTLTANPVILSTNTGGLVQLTVDAGPAAAGATYLVLGGISGIVPGTPWQPGFTVPLVLDPVTDALFLAVNTPLFQNAFGTLDAQGRATATFSVPGGVLNVLQFRTLSFAGIAIDALGLPQFVTNANGTVLLP